METSLYFNGKKIISKREDTEQNMNKWLSGGLLFLGQDQVLFHRPQKLKQIKLITNWSIKDTIGGSFEKQQSLSGTLSNINIFGKILNDIEIEEIAECLSEFTLYMKC